MILQNKKTGEVIENACIGVFKHKSSGDCERVDTEARSLEKVLEVWEDYKPKEPLIKDEKIRKAVMAWAEANGLEDYIVQNEHFNCCKIIGRKGNRHSKIEFLTTLANAKNHAYTIEELCGEEEE